MQLNNSASVFDLALEAIKESTLNKKITLTNACKTGWAHKKLSNQSTSEIEKIKIPGRPEKPHLVWPRDLPKRKLNSEEGRAALLHAICHIEFNAINLALDAVYRFQDMPNDYYSDWLKIAHEEAKHFSLLYDYLNELGFTYGSFPAHNGLWELAVDTDYDVLVRMALVPRVMEARGLDVTPGIIKKFENIGDSRAVEILHIILEEEKGHVDIGNRWFNFMCNQRNVEPLATFKQLIAKHIKGQIKPPFAREARLEAGFTIEDINMLESL